MKLYIMNNQLRIGDKAYFVCNKFEKGEWIELHFADVLVDFYTGELGEEMVIVKSGFHFPKNWIRKIKNE